MKKSRRLVTVVALATGLLGVTAGSPRALPAPAGTTAPSTVHEVAAASAADTFDVTGSGTRWKRWACWTCFGIGVGIITTPLVIVGNLVILGCAKACY